MTATATSIPDLAELADVSASLGVLSASAVVGWAWEPLRRRSGAGGVVPGLRADRRGGAGRTRSRSCSSTSQYHFAETLWYVDQVRRRYDLNLTVMQPEIAPDNRWQQDPDGCALRAAKVEPWAALWRARRPG
jgi:hypothetical protein